MSESAVLLKLYSYFRSSSAWRVRIALAFKQLPHEILPVQLLGGQQHQHEFAERNPLEQVPVLEVVEARGHFLLTQSLAILEYLEDRFPQPPLLPAEPELRARARQLAEIVNSGIQPFQNLAFQERLKGSGIEPLPVTQGYIERGLGALEAIAKTTAGRFMVRDGVTFADILLVPQLFSARRFGVDVERFPTLRRVELECSALPAFEAAHPNAQPDAET
jgi:maleylpyruvate isomerase